MLTYLNIPQRYATDGRRCLDSQTTKKTRVLQAKMASFRVYEKVFSQKVEFAHEFIPT